jgi:hypothetical protein
VRLAPVPSRHVVVVGRRGLGGVRVRVRVRRGGEGRRKRGRSHWRGAVTVTRMRALTRAGWDARPRSQGRSCLVVRVRVRVRGAW